MYEPIFSPCDILLPREGFERFSVVACDQYTSEPEYWAEVERLVGDAPSALRLILPEVWLCEADERTPKIHETMRKYLENGVFRELADCCVLVERTLAGGAARLGLVGAVDLERYDYAENSRSAVRATEKTVAERVPPRAAARRGAALELPHIMLLCNDPDFSLIEPLYARRDGFEKLYDFELMLGGGHLRGWLVPGEVARGAVEAFERARGGLVYAVGDGNHSLAAAKACWEEIKAAGADGSHPARRALCELVNLHSPALDFEPIHRLISDADIEKFERFLREYCDESEGGQSFELVANGRRERLRISNPERETAVGSLQVLLDRYLETERGELDYIHGEAAALALAERPGAASLLVGTIEKGELFPAVERGGALERKSFSMGDAYDKRFYLEGRRVV